jgi:hypothetical protein
VSNCRDAAIASGVLFRKTPRLDRFHLRLAGDAAAQGIGGAGPPQVDIGRASGGTPAKPGFLRSKKCAQLLAVISYLFTSSISQ